MQSSILNNRLYALSVLLLAASFFMACKKTDKYYGQLSDTPEIYTSLGLDYSCQNNGASRQYHVGDTLQIKGRFNAAPEQIAVQIGGVNSPVIDVRRKDSIVNTEQVQYYKTVEAIRVPLTGSMGTGRLTVRLSCRGYSLEGPTLYLLPKGELPSITDTLVWKQLMYFRGFSTATSGPLVDSFLNNPVFYPSYSGTGNIFFSQKNRIQLLRHNGNVEPIADLQNASDANGSFRIIKMYNGAVDQQEHTLYFSALTADSYKTPGSPGIAPDADSNWIFRYCKLDLWSKQLQVMNRTIVPIYMANVNALGTSAQLHDRYTGEGAMSQVNLLPFSAAWADNNGDVYFTPVGLNFNSWAFDNKGKANFYPTIYSSTYYSNSYNYLGKITPDGKVQYLMRAKADWPGEGPSTQYGPLRSNILSLDPVKAIMFTETFAAGAMEIFAYDLNSRTVISKLHPVRSGAGATGPFNLLDAITPGSSGAINYGGLALENGHNLALPGTANRFLYDLENVVYDFSAREAYHYAPVIVDSVRYLVPPGVYYDPFNSNRPDQPEGVLNFDAQGNLYKLATFYVKYAGGYSFYYDVRRTYILKH